jgi:hypothetical protein
VVDDNAFGVGVPAFPEGIAARLGLVRPLAGEEGQEGEEKEEGIVISE